MRQLNLAGEQPKGSAWGSHDSEQGYASPLTLVREIERRFGGGGFDLDPCCSEKTNVLLRSCGQQHGKHFTGRSPEDDGLLCAWGGVGDCRKAFVNPPWNDIGRWVDKALRELACGHIERAVFLVPARTSMPWWQVARSFGEVHAILGRVNYLHPETLEVVSGIAEHSVVIVFQRPIEASGFKR